MDIPGYAPTLLIDLFFDTILVFFFSLLYLRINKNYSEKGIRVMAEITFVKNE